MRRRIVKQGDDRPAQVTQEITEELANFIMADVTGEKAKIQTETLTAGADRNAGYNRDLISAISVANDWCLATRSPSTDNVGD